MTSPAVLLNESGQVTLDASGNGTVRMVPWGGSVTWFPSTASVKASSAAAEASCKIYIGPAPTDQWFVDSTLSGSTGDSTTNVAGQQVDTHGNALWAVWEGGDPGAVATLSVAGTVQTP